MKNNDGINPMIPGKKIIGIFGFCNIKYFAEATEVLQADIMMFVNEIAEIVHSRVCEYQGQPNKNIGDCFLLVWKFNPDSYENVNNTLVLNKSSQVEYLCDLSVMSFIHVQRDINIEYEMIKYNTNQKLKKKVPKFKVSMGFGLNLGWAIEGAIGSAYKIDASYLSPNVNMASRLEAATK